MDVERLKEIKERLGDLPSGEWAASGNSVERNGGDWSEVVSCDVECLSYCYGGTGVGVANSADAEFIAHSKSDIEFLLGALKQAYEDGVEHWQVVESWDSEWDDYPEPPYWLSVVQ